MRLLISTLLFFALSAHSVAAFCTWGIVPPEREYQPLDATEVFISYENGVQTLVLQPEWQGDATDFAIVYPTPGKPEITEASKSIFDELNDATNPWVQSPVMFLETADTEASSDRAQTVTVVEEKQVGEYDVTVLTATDADDLAEWLEENEFHYTAADADKVAYYVEQGGFYFIALKVNALHFQPVPMPTNVTVPSAASAEESTDDVSSRLVQNLPESSPVRNPEDWFWGRLTPLEITFTTEQPQLPMRTLKSDMPNMTFDLYTLSDQALYVPGVDTVYSNVVDAAFLQQVNSLGVYNPKGKWLVRQEITFDPSESEDDIYLQKAKAATFTVVTPGSQVRFDPGELNIDTGIIPGSRGQVVYTDGRNQMRFSRNLTVGSVGEDVQALQKLLNDEGFVVSESGSGSVGNESMYFGEKTRAALIRYQNFYRADILEPVGLEFGTGYFGPSTITFINR